MKPFHEYIDPRSTEYRLQPALATGIYYAHCAKPQRRAMLLHEDRSGSIPDVALFDNRGSFWLYEIKRLRITRAGAAQVLCQLLSYALDYVQKTPEQLAELYCAYKKRLGYSFYDETSLRERYDCSNQLGVLLEEFGAWFGSAPNAIGGRVARLAFLAPRWEKDAVSLITQVRSEGIVASLPSLKRYATGKASSKWIGRVAERAEDLETFRDADWIIERFLPPETWIVEEACMPAPSNAPLQPPGFAGG